MAIIRFYCKFFIAVIMISNRTTSRSDVLSSHSIANHGLYTMY